MAKRRVKGTRIFPNDVEEYETIVFGLNSVEAECPECGHVRDLEEDADQFHCECGLIVEFTSAIDALTKGDIQ